MSTLQFTHQQKKVSMRKCSTKFLKPRNGYTSGALANYLRNACHQLVNNKRVQLDANPLLKKILDIKEVQV